jgi:hypothetical protein
LKLRDALTATGGLSALVSVLLKMVEPAQSLQLIATLPNVMRGVASLTTIDLDEVP